MRVSGQVRVAPRLFTLMYSSLHSTFMFCLTKTAFFAWLDRLKDHFPHEVVKETLIPSARGQFGKTVQKFSGDHFTQGTVTVTLNQYSGTVVVFRTEASRGSCLQLIIPAVYSSSLLGRHGVWGSRSKAVFCWLSLK